MTRPALVRLFSTILRKDDEGFMLVTPVEKLSIAGRGCSFPGRSDDGGRRRARIMHLIFTTNVGDKVLAGLITACALLPDASEWRARPLSACAQGRLEAQPGAAGLLRYG